MSAKVLAFPQRPFAAPRFAVTYAGKVSPQPSPYLARLGREAQRARAGGAWSADLSMLAYLARTARPRARSIRWGGVVFPLRATLISRVVLCPSTGRDLVGVVDI